MSRRTGPDPWWLWLAGITVLVALGLAIGWAAIQPPYTP